MKIAVIGGGIYGCTIALDLDQCGHEVDLFEKSPDILLGASGSNQCRIHRGYHYPRSNMGSEIFDSNVDLFEQRFAPAVRRSNQHLYAIAREGSLTSPADFLGFCKKNNLTYEKTHSPLLAEDQIELTVRVPEALLDLDRLRMILRESIKQSPIELILGVEASPSVLESYDLRIYCAYSSNNALVSDPKLRVPYEFEICEKAVVKLPPDFRKQSIVVMDGPFMCLDPMGDTPFHLLGHVEHAVHARNIGYLPVVPKHLLGLIGAGLIQPQPFSRIQKIITNGARYIPGLVKAEHLGSFFTIRAVFPGLESTDDRPTVVDCLGPRDIRVFGGKLSNALSASARVLELCRISSPCNNHLFR